MVLHLMKKHYLIRCYVHIIPVWPNIMCYIAFNKEHNLAAWLQSNKLVLIAKFLCDCLILSKASTEVRTAVKLVLNFMSHKFFHFGGGNVISLQTTIILLFCTPEIWHFLQSASQGPGYSLCMPYYVTVPTGPEIWTNSGHF